MLLYTHATKINMFEFFDLFPKISNIIYTDDFHVKISNESINNDTVQIETNRINKFKHIETIKSPKYLFGSLCVLNSEIYLDVYDKSDKFKWCIRNGKICHCLNICMTIINNKLVTSSDKTYNKNTWDFSNGYLKHCGTNLYVSFDANYNIILSENKLYAAKFIYESNGFHFIKPSLRLKFDINNINLRLENPKIDIDKNLNKTACILLAAGNSSRFNTGCCIVPKQLAMYEGKQLLEHCVDVLKQCVDHIVIVTNSECEKYINNLMGVHVVINNINCRLKSIETGLDFINTNLQTEKILIHDSARAFINVDCINTILKSEFAYSQYYLPCVDGIMDNLGNVYDNSKYLNLCTPVCGDFKLYYFLFNNYVKKQNNITYEIVPILNILQIEYNLIKGQSNILKKVTFAEDLK